MTKEELRKSLDFVNEERERLQKENELYKTSLDESQEIVSNYKQRKEAAIKYIVKSSHSDWVVFGRTVLLTILRGEDND